MRYAYWVRVIRAGRLLAVLLATLIYFLLLAVDAMRFFPQIEANSSVPVPAWARFGFSALVALLFLAVGSLVWIYARNRLVALLLFGSSFSMMVTFAVETGAVLNEPHLSAIGQIGSALAILLFSALLMLFPKNYLSSSSQAGTLSGDRRQSSRQPYYVLILRVYLTVLVLLCTIPVLRAVLSYWQLLHLPDWLKPISDSFYLLALIGILATIVISYRKSTSLRVRQQQRILVSGVILTFAPFLLLTLTPMIVNLPSVDPQVSTITFVLLPLALGYSILRYQILVFDRYIRRAAAWLVGAVGLAVVGYLVFALSSVFLSSDPLPQVICVTIAVAIVAPFVWWLARVAIERLFFSEIAYYRRLVDQPDLLARRTLDINGAAQLITTAAVNGFEMQEACLFVLDEETGYYQLYPFLKDEDPNDASRSGFVRSFLRALGPGEPGETTLGVHAHGVVSAGRLGAQGSVVERIASAERPLFLSEASKTEKEMPTGLARYLATTSPLRFDPLLAPIRAQGKMIGILALGERGDHQPYAGPDFEVIYLIQARFSSVLETARLYAQASRHVAVLDALYSGFAKVRDTFETVEDAAVAYTRIAAEAVQAGAQMWLYDEADHQLHHIIHTGSGPQLISHEALLSPQEGNWSSWFYEGGSPESSQGLSMQVPSSLPQTPYFPFAWLPLNGGQKHVGALALTYPRPHLFSQEERRVLEMFADRFASILENVDFTVKLRAAYERQKELDRLKDQFIMTASHELRTPLTAVQGYIELFGHYDQLLPPEKRAEFIEKVQRGCDELTLMVENIMDASRVQVEVDNLHLSPVPLVESVRHVAEILEGMARSENRSIHVDIPGDIYVMADDLRLRQVLLNLVGNALKYSPAHTDVDVTINMEDENVTVCIRDYGLGVPPEEQEQLFERFFRLQRDMNSPVRGAGLGLYISKQLIEAMGGRIWVESTGKGGEGSVFAFTLQCAVVAQRTSDIKSC